MSLRILSVTGDTAKYLVLTLCRGGALFPQDLVNPFCRETHFASNGQVKTKMRPFRSIPSDQMDAFHPTNIYHPLSAWLEFLQLSWPRQSPYCHVVALEASRLECLQSLCSWVAVHKWDTPGGLEVRRHDPREPLNINQSKATSTQVVH
jgi:hypothetical protein